MSADTLLDQAAFALRERQAAYGDAGKAMAAIAARWSITLGQASRQEPADPERCLGRRIRRTPPRRQRQHAHRHQGRDLHLHVIVGT